MSGDARDFNTMRLELSSGFFFLLGQVPKKIHAILTETSGEHAPSYATVKTWVAQFQCGVFPPVMLLVLDTLKQ